MEAQRPPKADAFRGLRDRNSRERIPVCAGYDHVVSVEHEDRTFEGSEELVKRGFLIARDVLKPHLH